MELINDKTFLNIHSILHAKLPQLKNRLERQDSIRNKHENNEDEPQQTLHLDVYRLKAYFLIIKLASTGRVPSIGVGPSLCMSWHCTQLSNISNTSFGCPLFLSYQGFWTHQCPSLLIYMVFQGILLLLMATQVHTMYYPIIPYLTWGEPQARTPLYKSWLCM